MLAGAECRRPMRGFLRGVASGHEINVLFLRKSKHLLRKCISVGKTPEPHITEAITRAPTARQDPIAPLRVADKHDSPNSMKEKRGCLIELGMEMRAARFHHL